VLVTGAAFGVTLLVLAAVPTTPFAFPAALLMGLASMSFMTAATAIVQLRAEPSMRGRVLALQAIVFIGTTPIGGPIVGAICDAFGPRAGFAVGAVAAFGGCAWGAHAMRVHGHDREPAGTLVGGAPTPIP